MKWHLVGWYWSGSTHWGDSMVALSGVTLETGGVTFSGLALVGWQWVGWDGTGVVALTGVGLDGMALVEWY